MKIISKNYRLFFTQKEQPGREVEREWNNLDITTDCHGSTSTSQGHIEEVPTTGYDDWKQGAINGVKFALELINKRNAKVIITHIEGLTTDRIQRLLPLPQLAQFGTPLELAFLKILKRI